MSKVFPQVITSKTSLGLLPLLSVITPFTPASAQVIPADEHTHTQVESGVNRIDITGGQQSGDNATLFHAFEQFDITKPQSANFVTTSDTQNVVSRVDSSRASTINGTLQVSGSDANLYLMNPAGILMGPDAQLNLSGGFTATTATSIGFEDGKFAAIGNSATNTIKGEPTTFQFSQTQPGTVSNLGDLSVQNGESLTLISGTVINEGDLSAPGGSITLAAVEGESLVRISQGEQLLSLEVEAIAPTSTGSTSIGELLTGNSLSHSTALITEPDGTLRLGNSDAAMVTTSGTLSTRSDDIGGDINVLGSHVELQSAHLDASGKHGGGLIRVGGDYQGKGPVYNATETVVDQSTTLWANAVENGNGGEIIVWADDHTSFYGNLSAQGGLSAGDGGFAEVSGKTNLAFAGIADLSAPQGNRGLLLLDPENVTIGTGPDDVNYNNYFTLQTSSLFSDISITATNNITIEDLPGTTFPYSDTITFAPEAEIELIADSDGDGMGAFVMNPADTLRVGRGNVTISGAGLTLGTISTSESLINNPGGNSGIAGGNVTLTSSAGITVTSIDTRGIMVDGDNFAADGGSVNLNAANGDIVVSDGIFTTSITNQNAAGDAGNINLTAINGDIVVGGDIEAQSIAGLANAQKGGLVTLNAGGDISVQNIYTNAAAGTNGFGNNNLQKGGAVMLVANGGISTQDIQTDSIIGQNNVGDGGSVSIDSANAGISTGGITTSNGSVSLDALGSIDIDFVDASGGSGTSGTGVDITTQNAFRANDLIAGTNTSLSTAGTTDGSITISYSTDTGTPFVVGGSTMAGTAGSIETPTDEITTGSFLSSYTQGNIQLINRGEPPVVAPAVPPAVTSGEATVVTPVVPSVVVPPVVTPLIPSVVLPVATPVAPSVVPSVEPTVESPVALPPTLSASNPTEAAQTPTIVSSVLETLSSQLELGMESPNLSSGFASFLEKSDSAQQVSNSILNLASTNPEELISTFEQVETSISEEFRTYLGLPNDEQQRPLTSIATVQNTLADIETTTGAQPALVYVYFVPNTDSESTNSLAKSAEDSQQKRLNHPDDELEVMIITQGDTPISRYQSGVTRAQMEETSQTLRYQATRQFSAEREYLPPAQKLYDWIMRPLEPVLQQANINSLGFVMGTGIRTLPLAALHDGEHFLVEDYNLGLLPTFSLTAFNQGDSADERIDVRTTQVLAMGASQFSNQPDLPAVDAEVQLITDELWEGNSFLNEDFLQENLQTQIQSKQYGMVHLATHASFESDNLDNSYIQLWDEKLSINELNSLQLEESDIGMIILSACSTALGEHSSEYGFAGFAVSSGSQSALASLWPVNDEGTLGFMTQFYDELRQSSVQAEALRQAQLHMISGDVGIVDGTIYGPNYEVITTLPELEDSGRWDFSHPFYWSAFTMIGNLW